MWEISAKLYREAVNLSGLFDLKGKSMLYTSANGYMFSQLNKAGQVGIRLSKEDRQEFYSLYPNDPFESYGAIMKQHVLVPSSLLEDTVQLSQWLNKGFQYVNTLKSK